MSHYLAAAPLRLCLASLSTRWDHVCGIEACHGAIAVAEESAGGVLYRVLLLLDCLLRVRVPCQ